MATALGWGSPDESWKGGIRGVLRATSDTSVAQPAGGALHMEQASRQVYHSKSSQRRPQMIIGFGVTDINGIITTYLDGSENVRVGLRSGVKAQGLGRSTAAICQC